MSLESRLKSAVNALEKPFKGIIPENLMPEHSKWEPDESSEDDPTPSPEPELPDMDPLPYNALADANGYMVQIFGMKDATATFSYEGITIDTLPLTQVNGNGEYYAFNYDLNFPEGCVVGSTVDIEVSLEGYKTWTGTVKVTMSDS